MSYDVSIGEYSFNYTSNIGHLFHKHMDNMGTTGLKAIHGLTGEEAIKYLSAAWEGIEKERIELWVNKAVGEPVMEARYNAPNGWGSLVGALVFLGNITSACALNPKDIVHVCA